MKLPLYRCHSPLFESERHSALTALGSVCCHFMCFFYYCSHLLFLQPFESATVKGEPAMQGSNFSTWCKTSTGFMSGSAAQTIIIISTILSKKRKELHIIPSKPSAAD